MDSLKVGRLIYSLLNGDSDLTSLVGNKIYPIIVEKETTYPFIVYKRANIIPEYTKDYHLKDSVIMDIVCVSNNYSESVDVVSKVRKVLEDKKYEDIESITVKSADEDFIDNAYVQTISFNLKVKK